MILVEDGASPEKGTLERTHSEPLKLCLSLVVVFILDESSDEWR